MNESESSIMPIDNPVPCTDSTVSRTSRTAFAGIDFSVYYMICAQQRNRRSLPK